MKRVLIVDDSLAVRRRLDNIITSSGEFEVIGHAANGAEAVSAQQREHADIICMDVNMPVMDGFTALRSLVALDREVNVVMITSLGSVGEKLSEALKLGAKNVISKPFEPESVLCVLRQL